MRIRNYTSKIVMVSLSVALLCGCSSNGSNCGSSSGSINNGGISSGSTNSSGSNSSYINSNSAEYAQLINKVAALEAENRALKQQLEAVNHEAKATDTQVQDSAVFTDLESIPTAKMIEELSRLKVLDGEGTTFRPNETPRPRAPR